MAAVIEFHGFKDNTNRFVVKELAIVGKHFQVHLIFSAPYDESCLNRKMRRTARWLTNHFHFIKWADEGVPFNKEWLRVLCSQFSILHTKGEEKVRFLRQFHNNVQEIEGSYAYSSDLDVKCILPQHNDNSVHCAMRSATAYYRHIFEKHV